jgi:hypothetical protein
MEMKNEDAGTIASLERKLKLLEIEECNPRTPKHIAYKSKESQGLQGLPVGRKGK